MLCEKCGAKLDDDAMFCPKCGYGFGIDSTAVKDSAHLPTPKKTSIKLDQTQFLIRAISVGVIILSILTIMITSTLRYVVKGPEDTVEDFFSACNNMNLNGVLSCLDPKTAREYKLAVDLVGELSGWGVDTDSISELGGMFSKYTDPNMKILDMQTEYVKDGKRINDPFGIKKITASDAEVICTYIMNNKEETGTFVLHKYSGKWKLEGE